MPGNVNGRLWQHHMDHSQIIRSASLTPVRLWAAVWCSSVGSTWTLELRELDDNTRLGSIRDWISSSVPISQPEPTALAYQLLAARGLRLYSESTGWGTRSRHCVGYVCAETTQHSSPNAVVSLRKLS
jgi:hypothetical protein